MDPLQSLFTKFRVQQAVYTRVEATAPWGIDLMAYHHTKFGIVTQGECYIDVKDDQPPVKLVRGSCYLLPRGNAFRLRDRLDSTMDDFEEVLKKLDGRILRHGGGGNATTVIGGRFIFADDTYPLILDLLPLLIHFKVTEQELLALEATVQLLAHETAAPTVGSGLMVDRLADIYFIQTLRAYLQSDQQRDVGWLGAVSDEKLGLALRLIHANSEHPWTIASLANRIGMSRAAFAARFKDTLGTPPMAYLTRYRLSQAQQLLRDSAISIAQVAAKVGYDSEAAFNKAFKRELGVPPGAYRREAYADKSAAE